MTGSSSSRNHVFIIQYLWQILRRGASVSSDYPGNQDSDHYHDGFDNDDDDDDDDSIWSVTRVREN